MDPSNKTSGLVEGDYVVVVGDSIGNEGHTGRRMIIASVVAVGTEEVFLRCEKTNITFKRPLDSCCRLPTIEYKNKLSKIKTPELGDLVLSFSGGRFTKEKKVVGILIEIVDNPPNELDARILCGEETHIVSFKSLIVVERK